VGVEIVARGLEIPWALAFAPDGRLFVTERPGRVRILQNGTLLAEPALTISDVFTGGESGVLGLALHPSFGANRLVYLVYTASGAAGPTARLVRYREVGNALGEAAVLLDDVPAANVHNGARVRFGPDGALYVVWDNYNVTSAQHGEGDDEGGGDANRAAAPAGVDNRSQVLLAKSTDGGNTFSTPVKVADYYDLPDCVTYQEADAGVACVPEKGETMNSIFRAANYPSGAINPRDPGEIEITFGSYINRHSNEGNGCVPQGVNPDTLLPLYDGVKTPGACNNDILVSRSTNAGRTFTGGDTDVRELPSVRQDDPRADQFWQWAAFDPRGRLAVSYYDRAYGNDESTGFSDMSLSGSRNGRTFATRRVTSASMPPATQFNGEFFGDYSGLSAGDVAHPFWMDTRDPELFACRDSAGIVTLPPSVCTAGAPNAAQANDQNLYTRAMAIPLP